MSKPHKQVKDITDEEALRAVQDWRGAVRDWSGADLFADELLAKRTGAPLKVALRKLENLSRRGLIGCGVSIRTAWVVGDSA